MTKTTLTAVALALTLLSAAPRATTCAPGTPLPAGAAITPDCTYVVEQVDPGVWRDNLNQIWVFLVGQWPAVKVNLADLHIGRWLTGK